MRIPRFYVSAPLHSGQAIELPGTLFRHAIQVLRLQAGDPLILFDGQGGEFTAELSRVEKRRAEAVLKNFKPTARESGRSLTLVQSIIKPDKMDFALQKSVELGVSAIQPLISQRSVVRLGRDKLAKKHDHWRGVAISAAEQSGRTRIPSILPALDLTSWLTNRGAATGQPPQERPNEVRLLLMPGEYPRLPELPEAVMRSIDHTTRFSLLIGPEGGFSEAEAQLCLQHGVIGLSLGPRILRAETAALTALALLQHQFGDL